MTTILLTMLGLVALVPPAESGTCFVLGLNHTGNGDDPSASPSSSPGCQFHEYHEGTVVSLTAQPGNGWQVEAWNGTDDDASTDSTNTITMPAAVHFVSADYLPSCLTLDLGHSGLGADPLAVPLGDGSVWTQNRLGVRCDALGLAAGDVDGDGDLDALAGLSDVSKEVVWWENLTGDATSWSAHQIAAQLNWPISVDSADFDGDGDTDVAAALLVDHQVVWFRNDDAVGTSWTKQIVADPVNGARDVVTVDFDNDGDPDIVGASRDANRILWWENGNAGTSWTEHEVATGFSGANSVAPADFDGDGDLDVAGAAQNSDQVGWFENLSGDGTSWASHILQSGQGDFDFALEVVAADLNGDNEPDIMATALLSDRIRWWENLGQASAFLPHDVDTLDRVSAARAADLNLDGDLDVVAEAQEIVSWRNKDGQGTAWAKIPIKDPYINTGDVITADFDGDGDVDVLASQEVPCSVDVFVNTYSGTCPGGDVQPKDRVRVIASPAPGWRVAGWSGTEDDSSTELTNMVKMPLTDHEVLVHYEQDLPFPLGLSLGGVCPGAVDLTISGATPDGRVAVFAGRTGSETLNQGPCAGTDLDITSSRLLFTAHADGNGDLHVPRTFGAGFCGRLLQVVDTASCGVSNPAEIP